MTRPPFVALAAAALCATLALGQPAAGPASASVAPDPVPSPSRTAPAGLTTFHPVTPHRLLDSRTGLGGPATAVPGRSSRSVVVAGGGGVPASGAAAVLVNLSAMGPRSTGHLTIAPSPGRLSTAVLAFTRGRNVSMTTTALLSPAGTLRLLNTSPATVHVAVDVLGWYDDQLPLRARTTRDGSRLKLVPATRLYSGALAARRPRTVPLGPASRTPANVTAVLVRVTADQATHDAGVTLSPAETRRPPAVLTALRGQTRSNLVTLPVTASRRLTVELATGSARVALDVVGYYLPAASADTGRFSPLPPHRLLYTRTATGGHRRAVRPRETLRLPLLAAGGLPTGSVGAVELAVTTVGGARRTAVTVHPSSRPGSRHPDLTAQRRQVVTTRVVVPVGSDGSVRFTNGPGTVHLLVDVVGWFGAGSPAAVPAMPSRVAAPSGYAGRSADAALTASRAPSLTSVAFSPARLDPAVLDRTVLDRLVAAADPMALPTRAPMRAPLYGGAQAVLPRWRAGYLPAALYPAQVGQLYLAQLDPQGRVVDGALCSGSVVGLQTVLTAAHCLYRPGTAYPWDVAVFLPGLQGTRGALPPPYEVWLGASFSTDHVYDRTPNRRDVGRDFYAADYAAVTLHPAADGRRIGEVVAPLPVVAGAPAGTKLTLGYPATGRFGRHCAGGACYQWFCQSPTAGYVEHAPGWAEVGLGCRLGGGNSGGPVLQEVRGRWSVVSVVSNGPAGRNGESINVWGPQLNSWALAVIADSEQRVVAPA